MTTDVRATRRFIETEYRKRNKERVMQIDQMQKDIDYVLDINKQQELRIVDLEDQVAALTLEVNTLKAQVAELMAR
jgi:hypothetical protein